MESHDNKRDLDKLPYSYHCFAWPFQVVGSAQGQAYVNPFGYDGYAEALEKGIWHRLGKNDIETYPYDISTRYAIWKYLSNSARLVFQDVRPCTGGRSDPEICRIYVLDLDGPASTYHIERRPSIEDDPDVYDLRIVGVELHLYTTGCGILWIRAENDRYDRLDDIKDIADYGRRIAVPYLPSSSGEPMICADVIRIDLHLAEQRQMTLTFDAREGVRQAENCKTCADNVLARDLDRPHLFDELLQVAGYNILSSSDERMFELEAVLDDGLSSQIASLERPDSTSHPWDQDQELQKSLYELVYVDPANGLSNQGQAFRLRQLNESIYPRWLGYGTLHAATSYSLLLLAAHDANLLGGVVTPFLTEYPLLASLALTQRTVAATCRDELSCAAGGDGASWLSARQRYAVLMGQLNVAKASEQEQGAELYALIRGRMGIDEELSSLGEVFEAVEFGSTLGGV